MTIKEIATLANVSVATVSYVLNNTGRVSPEIREKVWNIAREYGFTPNANGRNLVKKRNLRIGIMISNTSYLKYSTFFNNIAAGVIDKISKYGMDLVILLKENIFENWTKNAIGVDGVIVIDPVSEDIFIDWMSMAKLPFAVIGRCENRGNNIPTVDADNYGVAYEATKLLLEKGHRNILCALGPRQYTGTDDMKEGIKKAIDEFGCVDGIHYCYSPFEINENLTELNTIFRVYPEITAIVAASDLHALNINRQLIKLGLRVFDDVSLICLSGSHITKNLTPRISSYYTQSEKIGEMVADKLLELLKQNKVDCIKTKVGYTFDFGETIKSLN